MKQFQNQSEQYKNKRQQINIHNKQYLTNPEVICNYRQNI